MSIKQYGRKHRHRGSGKHRGQGYVAIGPRSGLRKLMRAARRGKIPDERMVTIAAAEQNAARRYV